MTVHAPACFIFDLDGTLAFTEHVHLKAYHEALTRCGLPSLSEEEFHKYFGLGMEDILHRHLFKHGLPYTRELHNKIRAAKLDEYEKHVHLVEENEVMVRLLRALNPHYNIALATTASRRGATAVLRTLGLGQVFDYKVFGDDVEHPKPHPECFEKVAAYFKVRPHDCIIFEDSEAGIKAANAFGAHVMKVIR